MPNKHTKNPVSLKSRLDAHVSVDPTSGCWHWTGSINKGGYGKIRVESRSQLAHRISFILSGKILPEGKILDHTCHKPDGSCPGGSACLHRRCINPDHLEPVTHLDNAQRGLGGSIGGVASGKTKKAITHCPQGHPYSGENLYTSSNGHRRCKECGRQSCNRRYHDKVGH
jgi:hypothetical protein